jgi:hypothetical protein
VVVTGGNENNGPPSASPRSSRSSAPALVGAAKRGSAASKASPVDVEEYADFDAAAADDNDYSSPSSDDDKQGIFFALFRSSLKFASNAWDLGVVTFGFLAGRLKRSVRFAQLCMCCLQDNGLGGEMGARADRQTGTSASEYE